MVQTSKQTKVRAGEELKVRVQKLGDSMQVYIQSVLRLCQEVNPDMPEGEKISPHERLHLDLDAALFMCCNTRRGFKAHKRSDIQLFILFTLIMSQHSALQTN